MRLFTPAPPRPIRLLWHAFTRWLYLLGSALLAAPGLSLPAHAGDTIKIGALVPLEGHLTNQGEDALRGVKMALAEFDYQIAGKKIELVPAGSNGKADSAYAKARELIEQHQVDILIGPMSGDEGLAVKDYAKTRPGNTFINGVSAAQDTTLRDPAANFFRFSTDGAQWIAGLGNYVYEAKKYRKIAIVAEDYSFPHTQIFGFMHEFCGKGGRVIKKLWVAQGADSYAETIYSIPKEADAILVVLAGKAALNFLTQYYDAGNDKPLIGSPIMGDQVVLSAKAKFSKNLIGMPSATPVANANPSPAWKKFVAAYKKAWPQGYDYPTIFSTLYYIETKAALLALQKVNGDLSDGQKRYQAALAKVSFETPIGKVSLDENRNGIADNFVTEVVQGDDGKLFNKLIRVAPQVSQTLGLPRAAFLKLGKVGRDNPECP